MPVRSKGCRRKGRQGIPEICIAIDRANRDPVFTQRPEKTLASWRTAEGLGDEEDDDRVQMAAPEFVRGSNQLGGYGGRNEYGSAALRELLALGCGGHQIYNRERTLRLHECQQLENFGLLALAALCRDCHVSPAGRHQTNRPTLVKEETR
jgi:hypothetical protein